MSEMKINPPPSDTSFADEEDSHTVWCLEGNGCRPSHIGIGFRPKIMYTLNTIDQHKVAYIKLNKGE